MCACIFLVISLFLSALSTSLYPLISLCVSPSPLPLSISLPPSLLPTRNTTHQFRQFCFLCLYVYRWRRMRLLSRPAKVIKRTKLLALLVASTASCRCFTTTILLVLPTPTVPPFFSEVLNSGQTNKQSFVDLIHNTDTFLANTCHYFPAISTRLNCGEMF